MSIAGTKILNLTDAQLLYNDLRGRVENRAEKLVADITTPAPVQTFPDGSDGIPMALTAQINPVQDLHGYDFAWAAGCGKNIAPSLSASSSASGITATLNSDGTVTCTGQNTISSAVLFYTQPFLLKYGYTYILTGCPSGGGDYRLDFRQASGSGMVGTQYDIGSGASYTPSEDISVRIGIRIAGSYSITGSITFKPMVRLSTVTDDTYAPYSNICAITGWTGADVTRTGKNLLNQNNPDYADILVSSAGVFSTNTNFNTWEFEYTATYTASIKTTESANNGRIVIFNSDGSVSGYQDFHTTADTDSTRTFTLTSGQKATVSIRKTATNRQVEFGSSASAYEAFGTVYQITFPDTPGTVYGGTLTVNKDGTGEIVADHKIFDMGDYEWSYTQYGFMQMATVLSDIYHPSTTAELTTIKCDMLQTLTSASVYSLNTGLGIHTNGDIRVYFPTMPTDTAQFKTAVAGHKVVYPLATPVTYELNAPQVLSLLGTNNVWCDTGDVLSIEYNRPNESGLMSSVSYGEKVLVADDRGNVPIDDLIPPASMTTTGVVSVGDYGISATDGGLLWVNSAPDNVIKAGSNTYRPIVPKRQHNAVFYGLAKAAGVDMSSSSNEVGTYTDTAKAAIQTMIGVEPCVTLIEEVEGTTPSLTCDPNVRYVCGEVSTISITPPASGTVDVWFTSGSTATVLTVPNTVKFPVWFDSENLEADTVYEIMITDGAFGSVMTWAD